MPALVPFGATDPKSRLGPVLDADERREFAEALLRDVVGAVRSVGVDPLVVSTEPLEGFLEVPVRVDERSLSAVVDDAVTAHVGTDTGGFEFLDDDAEADADEGLAVLAADLGLVTPETVRRLLDAEGGVVVAPGRGVGTNALVVRTPGFRVDYHGASFLDHREAARAVGVDPTVVDSFRLATDVDEPADLVETYVHGEGAASDWLRERFELDVDADAEAEADEHRRVGLVRRDG